MKGFWLTTSLLPQTVDGASVTAKSMIHACQAINTSDVVRYHYRLTSVGILIWVSPHGHHSCGGRRRTRKQSRWKAKLARAAKPCGDFQKRQRLPAGAVWLTIEILHSRRCSRRLTLIPAGDTTNFSREIAVNNVPILFFFFISFSFLSIGRRSRYDTCHAGGYEYAISRTRSASRVTVPARFASACSSHKRIDVHYPTTKITPEEIDFPTREIAPMLLRRLMHSWLLRYTSLTRGHAIAVCLAARSRCALRGARPDWSLITIN